MNSLMESWPRKHLITVEEYHRMAEVGLLAPDARVELIEGEIIDMAPIGTGHGYVLDELTERIVTAVHGKARVRVQGAVRLDERSEPQPDVALLVPRPGNYRAVQPSPADVLLLIEVSDTTLRNDRDVKVPLYARHGIPEVWIVDLENGELRIYRSPEAGRYVDQQIVKSPGVTPIAMLPGITVDFTGVLSG